MSPRRNTPRRRRAEPAEEPQRGWSNQSVESGPDGGWIVRQVTGASSTKVYRCPGCDQEIRPGVPHVVAWAEHDTGAGDRRHWHSACWNARSRRAPNILRGRGAPRY